ncbi:FAD-dependent oxidoreductase [Burkholderia cenocepacia]|uniref:FAD-dependent oxidoreductase n=1 Tax=Burkholderia cenocepacia TaxID=95486 RepID=UPI0022324039|nr:FAD-dependent oxidoreductase [Burkholderia cenocepacia]MCW5151778.1 FAD-dependent oxidoreductase [Burkholderia cenocepacia]MCW5159726.1 FAD-dependent oxidoreductase [Burkholderia cenocepacia]MCW5167670.1 FAD-dependent oxidoreductase [Burkholderia cenocepacia]
MRTPGTRTADVAIVGGGYTGLSAAIHLAEQGATVDVCDADPPGDVPSAFNFGSVASVAPALPRGPVSAAHAQAAERAAAQAIAYLKRFVDSRNLACGWAHPGHITLACDDAPAAQLAHRFACHAAQQEACVAWLDARAVTQETGAAHAIAGLLNLRFALIRPRALRDAMRVRAATLGVRIRRGARVHAVRPAPGAAVLDLGDATVDAGAVLVCAEDAWSLLPADLRPPLERYGTHLLATRILDGAKPRAFAGEEVDVLGIGVGPFNLSLAALLAPLNGLRSLFVERRPEFRWHPGLMLADSSLTTSFLKDLVTLADPCSRYSFIAFLQRTERLYSFANARFPTVRRREFEQYMRWVCASLDNLRFDCEVESVVRDGRALRVTTSHGVVRTANLVVGVGLRPTVPACARPHLGADVLHSSQFCTVRPALAGRRVAIVGGGQSGAELALHLLGLTGDAAPAHIAWLTRRENFLPMDDSPFVNEWFVPQYNEHFSRLSPQRKRDALETQRLASDGVTLPLLTAIYQRLYEITHIEGRPGHCALMPGRRMANLHRADGGFVLSVDDGTGVHAPLHADVVLLATGSEFQMPGALESLRFEMHTRDGAPELDDDYAVRWNRPSAARIFFQNAARTTRGIADPNLSLAAWRSGRIANAIAGASIYEVGTPPGFVDWPHGEAPQAATQQLVN